MATDWGGGGTRRASSKGSGGAERGLGEAAGTTHVQDQNLRGGEARKERAEEEPSRKTGIRNGEALTHVKEVSGRAAIDSKIGGPSPAPCVPGLVQVLDVDIGGVIKELSAC